MLSLLGIPTFARDHRRSAGVSKKWPRRIFAVVAFLVSRGMATSGQESIVLSVTVRWSLGSLCSGCSPRCAVLRAALLYERVNHLGPLARLPRAGMNLLGKYLLPALSLTRRAEGTQFKQTKGVLQNSVKTVGVLFIAFLPLPPDSDEACEIVAKPNFYDSIECK